jgi:hypothetical protein
MTIYELHYLINVKSENLLSIFQVWMAVSTVLVVAGYVIREEMDVHLRRVIIFIYVMHALSSITALGLDLNSMYYYTGEIKRLGGLMPPPESPIVPAFNIVALCSIYIFGSYGCLRYFCDITKSKT